MVHVFESRAPRGEPSVEWFLLTNLPIDSAQAITFAVDCYRARWSIEEFFKALKTGCLFERRQLESAHSLLNALAILTPVAWRLLLLRHLARPRAGNQCSHPQAAGGPQAVAKKPIPAKPSARDAMLALAALGGLL